MMSPTLESVSSSLHTSIRAFGRRAAAVAAIAWLAACGSGDTTYPTSTPPPPPPATLTVNATPALTFTPSALTVHVGDTVSFAFGTLRHNVFFDAQANAPADIAGDNVNTSVSRVFTTAGTYRYTCHIHPAMNGTVVVRPQGS